MTATKVRVAAENASIGMYVYELDRPWLETPFLFQGFKIQSDEDIEELRKHCEYIIVDAEQTDDDVELEKHANSPPSQNGHSDVVHETVFSNESDFREAIKSANVVYDRSMAPIKDVLRRMREGGKLDIQTAETAVQPVIHAVSKNPSTMTWLAALKKTGDYLYSRACSSAIWATVLARHIGMENSSVQAAALGGLLMDIGKLKIAPAILDKPGRLDESEIREVRRHVEHSVALIREAGNVDPQIIEMVRTHHERHDGSGYPRGLKDTRIPILGRIAGIIDYYDARTTKRTYATPLSSYDCLRTLNKLAGTQFQTEMVEQFIQAIGFFPPGTLVELNDHSVGVVVAQNRRFRLKPEVMLLLDADLNPLNEYRIIDLQMRVKSPATGEELFIDKGLEPGSYGIDPAEFFLD